MGSRSDFGRKMGRDSHNTEVNKKDVPLKQLNTRLEGMPSASAKIEKVASNDAADPLKQLNLILEKKVRNLEKRKLKLDNYRSDVKNGKELNDDQKLAVNKYDQVVELLEYSKDLCKSINSITLETTRIQKKLAKKEQIERQQHEIHRLQEALYYKYILSCLESGEARNDFLNGENGAVQVSIEDMYRLNQLYKLLEPNLPNDQADVESHFHALSENLIFLVEGRNKEVAGTTYKTLKDLLLQVKESGYFSKPSESNEVSSDDAPELDEPVYLNHDMDVNPEAEQQDFSDEVPKIEEDVTSSYPIEDSDEVEVITEATNGDEIEIQPEPEVEGALPEQNGTLPEVLSQGSFNFLQESQIELDTPHMDPAVVSVHHLPPPSTMAYPVAQFAESRLDDPHDKLSNGIDHASPPVQPPHLTSAMPTVLGAVQHHSAPDFDPTIPIPTQTYTNQNFTVMQNMIIPPAYVPVTMHHGPIPPHMSQMTVVPGLSTPVSSPPSAVPLHVAVTSMPIVTDGNPTEQMNGDVRDVESEQLSNGISSAENVPQNDLVSEKMGDAEGFTTQNNYQRGFRGRGRGRGPMGGFYRPRGYNNVGRGGYQNNYFQGNFRRGGPRGAGRGNGNMRGGRGTGFRQQQQPQQQQQQGQ